MTGCAPCPSAEPRFARPLSECCTVYGVLRTKYMLRTEYYAQLMADRVFFLLDTLPESDGNNTDVTDGKFARTGRRGFNVPCNHKGTISPAPCLQCCLGLVATDALLVATWLWCVSFFEPIQHNCPNSGLGWCGHQRRVRRCGGVVGSVDSAD